MGLTYTIKNQSGQYFITCTVHQWADVFTRREYADILLDSIRFCQQRKGLLVHCWVLMSNQHMIVSSDQGRLSGNPGEIDHPKPEQTDHLKGWRKLSNFAGEDFQFSADLV